MASLTKPALVVDPAQFSGQQRRSNRAPVSAPAVLFSEDGQMVEHEVAVFDLSLRGIGFRSQGCLRVGSTHRLDLQTSSLHLASRLVITRCDQRQGSYEMGADFIDE